MAGKPIVLSRLRPDSGRIVALKQFPLAVCPRSEDLTRSEATSHDANGSTRRPRFLNKRLAQTEPQERAKALTNAVCADGRSRCISGAGRRLANTVLATLKEHEAASGRKYARRGERVTAFATTVEGFIGDLMLARNNIAADGWVFRPLHHQNFAGSEMTHAHISAAIAGLEFLGLIERAPHVRRFGTDLFVSGKMPLKGGDTRFRSTLKLTAMAREAGVDLGALAKHFRPLRRRVVVSSPP